MRNRDESKSVDTIPQPLPITASLEHPPSEMKDSRVATLGPSVFVTGGVTGSEDLVIDGRVDGRIELPDNTLTVGPNANIRADIVARVVTVFGSVAGTVTAHDRVHIRRGATVQGNVTCTSIALQDGAVFSGKVAMAQRSALRIA
jgi:cytoskeletal protein CcmA (bactofilin family)